jgi:hypothetical protein
MITAQTIVERTNQAFRDRADHCDPDDWTCRETYRDYVAVLRTGRSWANGERSVVASVVDTDDGRLWHYVASEALDSAGQDLPDSAYIQQLSPTCWQMIW